MREELPAPATRERIPTGVAQGAWVAVRFEGPIWVTDRLEVLFHGPM
jgi:hypothetical protein